MQTEPQPRHRCFRRILLAMGSLLLLACVAVIAAELWRQYELGHAVNEEVAAYREVEARFPHVTNWDQYWQTHAGDTVAADIFASAVD